VILDYRNRVRHPRRAAPQGRPAARSDAAAGRVSEETQDKMPAVIYQQPKSAMQSGKAKTDTWVLEFERSEALRPDPLMGWAGSGDTQAQVRLNFPTKDAAKAYAEKYGIPARVHSTPPKRLKLQAYADNFK
jgi:hypothetical protein